MTNYNLGYACINKGFSERPKKQRITTNRSMIKRTFKEKGLPYASELALLNSKDLLTIMKWNKENNIHFYRMSSDLIPWASEYQLNQLPDYDAISEALYEVGLFAAENNIRITSHPGPFNKLTSPKESVILNTIRDLEIHGEVFDLLCLPRTPYAKINIHVGAAYDDKSMAINNFCKNFQRLSEAVKTRLKRNCTMTSINGLIFLWCLTTIITICTLETNQSLKPSTWLLLLGLWVCVLWCTTLNPDLMNMGILESSHKLILILMFGP